MWGAVFNVVVTVPIAYGIALIAEKFLGVILMLMRNAPNSDGSPLISAVAAVQSNFLLLCIIGALVWLLGRAQLEARLGGA